MTTIYKVILKAEKPDRTVADMRTDYDNTMSYFNGVKNNPNVISMEVEKWQDSEDSDVMDCVDTIAKYYRDDVDMSEICSCNCTLSWCEKYCGRYYRCNNVAMANDMLRDREESED